MVSDCFWKNDRGRGVRGGAAAINNSLYITKHIKTHTNQTEAETGVMSD